MVESSPKLTGTSPASTMLPQAAQNGAIRRSTAATSHNHAHFPISAHHSHPYAYPIHSGALPARSPPTMGAYQDTPSHKMAQFGQAQAQDSSHQSAGYPSAHQHHPPLALAHPLQHQQQQLMQNMTPPVSATTSPADALDPYAPDSEIQRQQRQNADEMAAAMIEQMIPDDFEDSEEDMTSGKEKRTGRRKIKIEYIEDKSRRHITFSKRKAGIMKKVRIVYASGSKISFHLADASL